MRKHQVLMPEMSLATRLDIGSWHFFPWRLHLIYSAQVSSLLLKCCVEAYNSNNPTICRVISIPMIPKLRLGILLLWIHSWILYLPAACDLRWIQDTRNKSHSGVHAISNSTVRFSDHQWYLYLILKGMLASASYIWLPKANITAWHAFCSCSSWFDPCLLSFRRRIYQTCRCRS
jgi:hypothetical protein